MVAPILTISSLILTGVFIYLYKKEVNKKKDIEAKYQATEKFAEEAGSSILKLQEEKKKLLNQLATSATQTNDLRSALTLAESRNKINTIAKTAEKAVEARIVLQGEEKPKARRGRRKKPATTKD